MVLILDFFEHLRTLLNTLLHALKSSFKLILVFKLPNLNFHIIAHSLFYYVCMQYSLCLYVVVASSAFNEQRHHFLLEV